MTKRHEPVMIDLSLPPPPAPPPFQEQPCQTCGSRLWSAVWSAPERRYCCGGCMLPLRILIPHQRPERR